MLLHSTVLFCTVLYCTVLYCTVLYCTVLYCTVLYCRYENGEEEHCLELWNRDGKVIRFLTKMGGRYIYVYMAHVSAMYLYNIYILYT